MYGPHTVSLIAFHHSVPHLTLLRGVMLQAMNGRSVQLRGDAEAASAILYIPLSVRAENPSGESVSFLPPLAYASCPDPEKHWTLQPEGESAGRGSFFVRGELSAPCSLAEAREAFDDVWTVAGWQLHDYGSPNMRHWEVTSKVSSRFFQYGD